MSVNRYELGSVAAPDVTLLYISSSRYEADWHSLPHSHGFTELFLVTEGKGRFFIDTEQFPVVEGDLIIIEPNVEHTETSADTSPMEYIALGIDGFMPPQNKPQNQPWCLISLRNAAAEIRDMLRKMLKEMTQQEQGYELAVHGLLQTVLVQIARQIGFTKQSKAAPASQESAKLWRYIDSHYREGLTLDSLSQAVHISKYRLAHIFSQEFGISPIHYMLQLRLQECCELLRTTDFSIAQVARMTGFSSPSYFSQRFRQAEGMSPVQYRQLHKREKM